MTPNPSSPTGPARSGMRPGFLLVLLLLAGLCVALMFFFRGNRQHLESVQPQEPAARQSQKNPAPAASARVFPDRSPGDTGLAPPVAAPDPATAKLIAELLDESLPLQARRQAARALARNGSEAALTALKTVLAQGNSPAYLKAAIAEGLGESPNPEAGPLLATLVVSSDEVTARGAVRGLGARATTEAVNRLGSLLFDAKTPLSVRTEVALTLGDVSGDTAKDLLVRAVSESHDESIVENALTGLGKHPFSETETFFKDYLESPDTTSLAKVAAIEALGGTPDDVAPFLVKYLSDPDAEVRAAAAWALNTAGGDCGEQLSRALKQEADATVRTRIYQALQNQPGADLQAVLPLVQNESNPSARVAGFALLAGSSREGNAPEVVEFFRQTAVPELEKTGLQSENAQERLAAVIALNRARTPEALAALETIAHKSSDQRVVAAAQSLTRKK